MQTRALQCMVIVAPAEHPVQNLPHRTARSLRVLHHQVVVVSAPVGDVQVETHLMPLLVAPHTLPGNIHPHVAVLPVTEVQAEQQAHTPLRRTAHSLTTVQLLVPVSVMVTDVQAEMLLMLHKQALHTLPDNTHHLVRV